MPIWGQAYPKNAELFFHGSLDRQDKHERQYQYLPIEQKESYQWLASAERSQRCLSSGGARMVTHIGDLDSNLYEEWATVPNPDNHVLVRVCQDRRLLGQSQSLDTYRTYANL